MSTKQPPLRRHLTVTDKQSDYNAKPCKRKKESRFSFEKVDQVEKPLARLTKKNKRLKLLDQK